MDNELKTFGGVADNNSPVESTTTPEPVQILDSDVPEFSEPLETDISYVDPLLKEQQKQVAQMRDTLLSFDHSDLNSAKRAMQNITVMRIYHQISRIIRFTDMMDRLEDKLYDSIDMSISGMDSADPSTMFALLKVQEQLQETMVQSQQLLKPYLDLDITVIAPPQELEETSFGAALISQSSRNTIRSGAQALLTELRKTNPNLPQEEESKEETPAEDAPVNPETEVEDADVRNISEE